MTVSKKARLTFPIGYLLGATFGGLLGSPAETTSCSLRRHDPDQVPRVYPSCGILSAPLGLPAPARRRGYMNFPGDYHRLYGPELSNAPMRASAMSLSVDRSFAVT